MIDRCEVTWPTVPCRPPPPKDKVMRSMQQLFEVWSESKEEALEPLL